MAATESSTRAIAALDDLYRRHVGDVYRYTYAVLGNHADAEDVTQTTFVNALRALERGETPRNASHWLLAISHNLVRQRWRQAAARPAVVELVHDVPDEPEDGEDVELDELVRALQRIPPSQREALVMRELEGRPYTEIAELLGITTSALETLLFRARRSLAEELENLVTCQNAELSISKGLDGRLSRKERKRLDEHLAECEDCSRLAAAAKRQRKAFKGLALLPLPVGLALFKGAPAASAATVTTIGVAGSGGATGVGATGVGAAGAGGLAAGGAVAGGGAAVGGTLLGGTAVKIAAAVVAATVATGVGYEGVKAVREGAKTPASSTSPKPKATAVSPALTGRADKDKVRADGAVKARGKAGAPGQLKRSEPRVAKDAGKSAAAKDRADAKKAAHVPHSPKAEAGGAAKAKAPKDVKTSPSKAVGAPTPNGPKAGVDAGPAPGPKKPKPEKAKQGSGERAPATGGDVQPPAAPPQIVPPASAASEGGSPSGAQSPAGPGGSSGSAAPPAPATPPAPTPPAPSPVEGGTTAGADGTHTACPGGGSGPGNGSGCGNANGHDKHG